MKLKELLSLLVPADRPDYLKEIGEKNLIICVDCDECPSQVFATIASATDHVNHITLHGK